MEKSYKFIALIGIYFAVISIASCSNESEFLGEPTDLFEGIKEDKRSSSFTEFQLNTPVQIMVMDSLLIIHDQFENKGEKYFLSIVNRFSGELLKYYGREGRGPDEFLFPGYLTKIPGNTELIGMNNRRLFSYSEISIENVINDSITAVINTINEFNTGYSKIGKINSQYLIGTGFFRDGRFAVSDTSGKMISARLDYPFSGYFDNYTKQELGMPYQSNISFHPDEPIFVSATLFASNLDIISFQNEELRVKHSIHTNYPLTENESNSNRLSSHTLPENRAGYRDLDVTEKLIYTLYSGNKRSEGLSKYRSGNRVLIYDWEGNAYKQLNLDREAYRIAVSPDDQNLYTISLNENNEYYLNVYELSL